jgi:hypothetical protein
MSDIKKRKSGTRETTNTTLKKNRLLTLTQQPGVHPDPLKFFINDCYIVTVNSATALRVCLNEVE